MIIWYYIILFIKILLSKSAKIMSAKLSWSLHPICRSGEMGKGHNLALEWAILPLRLVHELGSQHLLCHVHGIHQFIDLLQEATGIKVILEVSLEFIVFCFGFFFNINLNANLFDFFLFNWFLFNWFLHLLCLWMTLTISNNFHISIWWNLSMKCI